MGVGRRRRVRLSRRGHGPRLDHGITVGDGVFETAKVLDGTPFALTRHLARLRRSAERLALALPWSDDDLRAACADAIAAAAADPANAARASGGSASRSPAGRAR
ncbi:MAG: aminotransferase class IV [Acidimicrobiales bacterium]